MFDNLDAEKQRRILNAAYKEFSEQGFEKASTNRIVKEAEIGKGMLFYYFKSKRELYHYLIDEGIKFITTEYLTKIDENQTDFIDKYKQIAKIKMLAYNANPYIFNFFGTIYINKETELTEELVARLEDVRKHGFSKLYNNNDTTLFRDDVSPDIVYKLIQWSLDGYEKELVSRLKGKKLSMVEFDPYWDEFYEYLDILKKIYYK